MSRQFLAMLVIGLISAASPLLTASASQDPSRNKPFILCSTTQLADFTRQIVGDRCRVVSLLGAGADPHTYMPTPNDARLALEADLCIQNGLNLEGKNWMGTLAKDAGKPVVTATDGLEPLVLDEGGMKVRDPHAWFTPRNAAIYVNNIVRAVSQLDPEEKSEYEARAQLYLQQLRVLDAWIRAQFNAIPPDRRILVTSHDAFNYFANEYGFKNHAPVGWSTGSELGAGMTPERRKMVIDSIRNLNVKAVFVETSVNPKLVREIAREAGVKIGGRLYSDSMGPEGSAGETYIGMMRENVLTILHGLK
ncbi:MAG: zinc ABC transporter substrate-binding protein [Desulfomonilaceae bacterium]|nr:zinc ABC transporter substrate-binding protein [Desulfomonilaceae bacterium]